MSINAFWKPACRRLYVVIVVLIAVCGVAVCLSRDLKGTTPVWLLAFAALLASLTALFGEKVREWIWRPDLRLTYVHGHDYSDKPLMGTVQAECYYFRLIVSNKGDRRAEGVEVHVSDLRRKRGSGPPELIRRFSMNLKWTNIGVPRLDVLLPSMERFCDIGHIISPSMRSQFRNEDLSRFDRQETVFSLDLEVQPNHGIHLLAPGEYELAICVVAANHRPVRRTLKIKLKGRWFEDLDTMLREGIEIQLL